MFAFTTNILGYCLLCVMLVAFDNFYWRILWW